jgi:hypothetical protein
MNVSLDGDVAQYDSAFQGHNWIKHAARWMKYKNLWEWYSDTIT